ncbi:hypothetical protein BpHYR1_036307 [Brachionus plicatilis]|uniref:Uncharacterized protein n=1 Tax=Brachionus plicatilis TaxID=10195 RepID=A0A3M7SLA2_BRAPC|nr:hypothetical protein BpHYR1_036307 [Brachionus plicatilis]
MPIGKNFQYLLRQISDVSYLDKIFWNLVQTSFGCEPFIFEAKLSLGVCDEEKINFLIYIDVVQYSQLPTTICLQSDGNDLKNFLLLFDQGNEGLSGSKSQLYFDLLKKKDLQNLKRVYHFLNKNQLFKKHMNKFPASIYFNSNAF